MGAREVWWIGDTPEHCDLCNKKIEDEFIDGGTKYLGVAGPWGCMCPSCHAVQGIGLGSGRGQRYKKQANGRFLKVEG